MNNTHELSRRRLSILGNQIDAISWEAGVAQRIALPMSVQCSLAGNWTAQCRVSQRH